MENTWRLIEKTPVKQWLKIKMIDDNNNFYYLHKNKNLKVAFTLLWTFNNDNNDYDISDDDE